MARRFAAAAPHPTTLAEAWHYLHPPRVLVADADEPFRAALVRELGAVGVEVVEVETTAAFDELVAPSSWRRGRAHVAPDLIVLGDLQPTGLGAIETLRRLRVADANTPVVLVSATSSFTSRLEAARLGVSAYLDKPIEAAQLGGLIACLVEA